MPILNYIPVPTWRDFIDILFLTLVAYQLYQWFRETRALRVLIGLVLLGGIYSIAKLWGLFLTTWVFQILWQVLLILLLILFQSEIRQVLEKVSPLRYLRSRRRVFRGAFAKDLAQALFDLAAEKIGALVVLTRDDNPSEFIHDGQEIMALPDPLLIKSIFNQHAPAHDGAIILAQDRLTHMRCILPLSKKENLPEQYGTRHRAALGLSEVTDAVCLVVSEERSEVSSIVAGEISVWSDPQELEERIRTWLQEPEIRVPTIQQFIKDLIVKNWKAKLSALALVFAAWLILASQQDIKITINAPIRYVNPAGELIVSEGSAKAVDLTLSGRQSQINDLRDRDVRVDVDLSGQMAGKRTITLSGKNVQLPIGVNVLRITPQKIEVNLRPPAKD